MQKVHCPLWRVLHRMWDEVMNSMTNMGSLVVALPPSDIWMTDEQAAEFLNYEKGYFKAAIICLKDFPKPKFVTETIKGRRWNLAQVSKWLSERPDTLKKTPGRPRKI